jgi:glycosyltransferase involved in cell wall biosynthesis
MPDTVIALSERRDTAALQMPLVSVVITNFNYRRYIRHAIDSVQRQSYRKFECIIVDDCSTDGSFDEIKSYVDLLGDRRFCVTQTNVNSGQMAAIKVGLDRTSGAFVLCLDGDDLLYPNALQHHLTAHLNASHSAGVTVSDVTLIDGDDTLLASTYASLVKLRIVDDSGPGALIPPEAIGTIDNDELDLPEPPIQLRHVDRSWFGWHGVGTSGMMWRRDLLDLVWPADMNGLRICADAYLYYLCHLIAGTVTINLPLFYYRLHRRNGFAKFPVIGGRFWFGQFMDSDKRIAPQVVNHLVTNADRFVRQIGAQRVAEIINYFVPRWEIYDHVRGSEPLRLWYGNGSEWRFKFYYGFHYRKRLFATDILRRCVGR